MISSSPANLPNSFLTRRAFIASGMICAGFVRPVLAQAAAPALTISWSKNILAIEHPGIPGNRIEIWYIEAYCRPGSTDRDWHETTIGHETSLLAASEDGKRLELRCALKDGVIVTHRITASDDDVEFQLTAHNPTAQASQVHWAQPCIRVAPFVQLTKDEYIRNCFVFLDGRLERMPTRDWATQARYTPGQVWGAPGVDRRDLNPRPLNPRTPTNGLIGCLSGDGKWLLATAWEPYQELFQGVIGCIHSDFRIGGLQPGQTKSVRGKIYILPADVPGLLKRYEADFPEHRQSR